MFELAARFPTVVPTRLLAEDPGRQALPNRFDLWLARRHGELACRVHADRRRLEPLVPKVEAHWREFEALDVEALRARTAEVMQRVRRRAADPAAITEALALACEAARRELGLRPYPVQVLGALVMLAGGVAEMATGEGKTLTAGLAAVCGALRGQPVHVVTVNDYLALRDGEGLRPLYAFFGLSVGITQPGQSPAERRAAYACHVTYCTNKDVVFDYMRTQLAAGSQVSTRRAWLRRSLEGTQAAGATVGRLGLAIVDEADSILVDEARTPLIISRERETGLAEVCAAALELARSLEPDHDFLVDAQTRRVDLTEAGRERLRELVRDWSGVWRSERQREHLCLQALSAERSFRRDRDYIVREGKVQIVDEFTGRVLPDRSWERGLHQMVEAKEGCEITPHRDSIARLTYQRFFTRYETLGGMTGTAREVAGELWAVYGLRVVTVPTHRPVQRRIGPTRLFRTGEGRWDAVAGRCREEVAAGRAVLVGTRSVQQSEALSARLAELGIEHEVLNAKQDANEAGIVALAGQPGRVTVATNMAGRGTDIKLHPDVAARGGLHVILTEFHESVRIDRQLYGRGARQGDPGSCEAMVSLEDDLFERFAPDARRALCARGGTSAELPPWAAATLRWLAQRRAERAHARVRIDTLRQEERMDRMMAFAGRGE
jgi:preprotein translocase subunit SecA